MAKLNINFDQVEAATGRQDPLPSGWQMLRVTEEEIKPTANNATTGNEVVSLKYEVIGGPYAGRIVYGSMNYKNNNQQAQDIGWGEMKALNEATGASGDDTTEWVNVEFKGYVKLVPGRKVSQNPDDPTDMINAKEYDAKNEIKGWKRADDETVQLNHNLPMTSGGAGVQVDPGFKSGGSPVPKVGAQAPAAKPAAPAKPATPVAAAKPAIPAAKPKTKIVQEFRMTEAAQGATEEQFREADAVWTREKLITDGYAEMVDVEVPDDEPAAKPAIPAAKPAAAAGKPKAPWEK